MAKKKMGLTPEQKAARSARKQARRDSRAVRGLLGPDAGGAKVLSDRFFPDGGLGRVQEDRPAEVQDILDRSRALETLYRENPRSAEQQDIAARQRAGLEGYTSQELQAQREAANRAGYDAYNQRLGELSARQNSSGFSGPASVGAQAFLERDLARGLARNEQDLFVRNADERNRRLSEYGNLISGLESEEFNRRRGTLQDYEGYLNRAREDELTRRQENLDRIAAENAGRVSTFFGGLGAGQARRANKFQRQYGQAYLDTLRYGYDVASREPAGPESVNVPDSGEQSGADGSSSSTSRRRPSKKERNRYGYGVPGRQKTQRQRENVGGPN